MFKNNELARIGNVLGQTVKVDTTTTNVGRGKFARVCIKMDLNRPLVPSININGRVQPVEYEGLYKVGFQCGKFGH